MLTVTRAVLGLAARAFERAFVVASSSVALIRIHQKRINLEEWHPTHELPHVPQLGAIHSAVWIVIYSCSEKVEEAGSRHFASDSLTHFHIRALETVEDEDQHVVKSFC